MTEYPIHEFVENRENRIKGAMKPEHIRLAENEDISKDLRSEVLQELGYEIVSTNNEIVSMNNDPFQWALLKNEEILVNEYVHQEALQKYIKKNK